MDLNLQIKPRSGEALIASYSCPCGCNPRLGYTRGEEPATEGCCCGNTFAVGAQAAAHLHASDGFALEIQAFDAPWGERLQAAWTIGPSVDPVGGHDPTHHHLDEHGHDHDAPAAAPATQAIDPVCGMTVEIDGAIQKGLVLEHEGVTYYFCGRGCKLEFGDDPAKYLDHSYVPSMQRVRHPHRPHR